MGRVLPLVVASAILLLLLPGSAWSQQTTGRIEGYIRDGEGRPVEAAAITVTSPDLQGQRTSASLTDGYFVIEALPIGVYELRIAPPGFDEFVQTGIAVRLGQTASLGFVYVGLRVHEIATITVTAKPSTVNPDETTVGGNLIAEEFSELPLGRGYRDLAALLPHVQESQFGQFGNELNFAGGTGYENKWFVDGADVSDPMFSNQGAELPYNFVRAVQVRVGGYQAEYRGAVGGVVDVITRRGSDTLRGEVFGYFLNDKTAGSAQVGIHDPEKGGFARWDVGGGLSGPITRDRLWYFLAYNPAVDGQEIDIAGLGLLNEKSTTHRFAARLDWRANDSNDFALSVVGNPNRREGPAPFISGTPSAFASTSSVLTIGELGVVSTTLKGFHYLSDAALLESNVSAVWSRNNWLPATEQGANEVFFYDHETDVISGGTWGTAYAKGFDFTAGLKGTWQLSAHTLKAGAEYRRYNMDSDYGGNQLERFYNPDTAEETYVQAIFYADGNVANRTPAAFVQDSWRLGNRLRLNLGLRWNGQYLVDSQGEVAVRITDQWQPRIGATYLLGAERRGKLFGSVGRYYQDLSLYAASSLLVEDSGTMVTMYDHDPRQDPSGGTVVYDGDDVLIDPLRGQYYDEATLGYERQIGRRGRFTVRGIYRELGNAIEDAWSESEATKVWGNPGRGRISEYPNPSRNYSALEFTYQLSGAERFNVLTTYVLSRNRGNMTGLSAIEYGGGAPNLSRQWDVLESTIDGHGLLPNDRTHVLKLAGSWRAGYGLTVGGNVSWIRGTPLNELGAAAVDPTYHTFIVPRGTAGRLPDIWDLSLRLSYDFGYWSGHDRGARILVDLLHIGSQQEVTNTDQKHYLLQDDDSNQNAPNPTYSMQTNYQPPFAVRLGAQLYF